MPPNESVRPQSRGRYELMNQIIDAIGKEQQKGDLTPFVAPN